MRSILVALDDTPAGKATASRAQELAKSRGARVTGVCVVDIDWLAPAEPGRIGSIEFKERRDRARLAQARDAEKRLADAFLASCGACGVAADVLAVEGEPAARLAEAAAAHDAIAIGRDSDLHGEPTDGVSRTVARLLKATPRPVLLVPTASAKSDGVLLAYDGSIPAARTMQLLVLLGLTAGTRIEVVAVDRDRGKARRRADTARQYLSLYGVAPEIHAVGSAADPAGVVAERARAGGFSLLAMGAYGHTGLKEALLGSFTKTLLAECPTTLFVYH
jgi:nucleotide-binding universal stress UspA family protein